MDAHFDRPVFIISPPRSGSTLLFETLARSPTVYTIGSESHQLIEGIPELQVRARDFHSNQLSATDATPAVIRTLRQRFLDSLRNRDGKMSPEARMRMLEKTPKNSLRIRFLAQVFPEANFVYLYRDPRQVMGSMTDAWLSGRFRTYTNLPGWHLPHWSLLLIPGWRELIDKPLAEIVATQWETTTRLLLDDLEQLPAERLQVSHYDALSTRPAVEVARLCAQLGFDWDQPFAEVLPLSRHTVSRPDPDKWRRHSAGIEMHLPRLDETIQRAATFALR